jgi:16S rRNA (cytidine1402-2'-O)-methyltransferase
VEVIGGVSAVTYFLAGLGVELESFRFIGFLPPKTVQRERLFKEDCKEPTIFFESPHRVQSTLEILREQRPLMRLAFAKELSKISEAFFWGTAEEILKKVPSWKGEWVGLCLPEVQDVNS